MTVFSSAVSLVKIILEYCTYVEDLPKSAPDILTKLLEILRVSVFSTTRVDGSPPAGWVSVSSSRVGRVSVSSLRVGRVNFSSLRVMWVGVSSLRPGG